MVIQEPIEAMPAEKVAECLVEYNKWVKGEPPYEIGFYNHPFSRWEIVKIIERATELLKEEK